MFNLPDLLRFRYGKEQFNSNLPLNECLEVLLSHRSIRAYSSTPLPNSTLELLVASAQSASTSSNLQTWSLVAVESQERKAQLSKLAGNQNHILTCPLFLVWLADLARLAKIADNINQASEGLDYLEMFVMATVDAAIAAQNAAIAAESLGLGIVYIGAMRNHPEEVAAVLNLPPHLFAVFGMCVGFPESDNQAVVKPRLPLSAVLHHETYSLDSQQDAIANYNQTMREFYTQQQMNVQGDWSEHSISRVANRESLKGRDRLKEALNNLGFKLR